MGRVLAALGVIIVSIGAPVARATTTSSANIRGVVLFVGDSNVKFAIPQLD